MRFRSTKSKEDKHPIPTIPPNIIAGIRVTIQSWSIRNLTDFRRHAQYRLKRLLLVLLPAGQSCQISATRHVNYLSLLSQTQ
jgi:hypothetical protein